MKGRAAMGALVVAAMVAAVLVRPEAPVSVPAPALAPDLLPLVGPEPWPRGSGSGETPADDPEAGHEAGASWAPAHIESYALPVEGEQATGYLGVPAAEPTTLVLLSHPWGVSADQFQAHLQAMADRGALAVAMEFRGERDAYKVAAGAQDTVAAALDLQARHPGIDRTLLYGHSMGGQVALLAAASAPPGTFDYVFVGAGVTDLEALWNSNLALRPAIEHETGGTPGDVPQEYAVRSPLDRVADLAAQGVARFFVVHGAGDAPVPVDHAERLYEALASAGLPVSYYVVTTDEDPQWCMPVVGLCPDPAPASHWAGRFALMLPFIDHRIQRQTDPQEPAVRGTYDGDSGTYDPSDVG